MSENIISERIIAARNHLGITKAEAARRLNLSSIGYCRYEYGQRTPSMQTLEVIAQCFGTSVDYLTGKTDDISSDKIIVDKNFDPELFSLIESLKSCDNDQIRRLSAYASQLLVKQLFFSSINPSNMKEKPVSTVFSRGWLITVLPIVSSSQEQSFQILHSERLPY